MKILKKTMIVFTVLLASLTLFVTGGCKKADFDINGNWYVEFSLESSGAFNIGFTGSRTAGSVIYASQYSGDYAVDGKDVEFVVRIEVVLSDVTALFIYEFSGRFDDEDHLSGTVIAYLASVPGSETNGTWSAERL